MKTTRTSIALILTSALALTGCAAWNKYDLRKVTITAPSGSPSVAVACVDQRETLRQGDIGPDLIGVTRNGYGIPYWVKTATKDPVAKEIAEVVVRGFGSNRKLAPPMSYADTNSAKAALRGTGTDRQILVLIDRYNSDTLIRTEFTPSRSRSMTTKAACWPPRAGQKSQTLAVIFSCLLSTRANPCSAPQAMF